MIQETTARWKLRLTDDQTSSVVGAIRSQPRPLLLALMLREAMTREPVGRRSEGRPFPTTVEKLVTVRFRRLEYRHGKFLVGAMARYLTSSSKGLAEMELLDILSCNNDLMVAVLPPGCGSFSLLRFPYDIWHDIRTELGQSLGHPYSARSVGRTCVLSWVSW